MIQVPAHVYQGDKEYLKKGLLKIVEQDPTAQIEQVFRDASRPEAVQMLEMFKQSLKSKK